VTRPVHVVLAVLLAWVGVHGQGREPTFRSGVRVVTISAWVERGRRPLSGLTADDFMVLDNGVPQAVTQLAYETVPLDLTVIVDASQSTARGHDAIQRDANRIAAFLRPSERLRLLAIDTYVQELVPMGAAQSVTVRPLAMTGGFSAVHDAIAAALLGPADPERRRLVVALTDLSDNASATSPAQLVSIARASDSVLMVVQVPSRSGGRTAKLPYLIGGSAIGWMTDTARMTGGELIRASGTLFGNGHVDAVERLIEMFRQSYVLRYTPTGVQPEGWHGIEVSVKGERDVSVRARPGYFGG
jgi:VWFA-related protein